MCGRIRDEGHPQLDRVRRRRPSQSPATGDNLAAIGQQPFVHRTPPWTTWRRCIQRRQHAAAELPAHERQSRPAKWQVPRCPADWTVIRPDDQLKAGGRIVTHSFDLIEGPRRGGRPGAHAPIVGQTRSTLHYVSEGSGHGHHLVVLGMHDRPSTCRDQLAGADGMDDRLGALACSPIISWRKPYSATVASSSSWSAK